jgi:deazaflavin-dependent oxidoreductase (nitroreductase family)
MTEAGYTAPDITLVGDEHVRQYRATAGAVGHMWNGVPTLLLITTGRRSGERRTSAMIYGEDAGRYLVIASQGGAPTHPNWYVNLQQTPNVEIQVGADVMSAVATTAGDDERTRLWKVMTDIWPNFDVYQSRTERVIPVVVLTPTGVAAKAGG